MHNYGKLILQQRKLIALIHHCSDYRGDEELKFVNAEYDKLHVLLDEEEKKLKEKGLNPIDYHPMPTYARDTRKEQYEDNERDLNKLLNRNQK